MRIEPRIALLALACLASCRDPVAPQPAEVGRQRQIGAEELSRARPQGEAVALERASDHLSQVAGQLRPAPDAEDHLGSPPLAPHLLASR